MPMRFLLVAALCLSAFAAQAETVQKRLRVGNNVEGMTYAPDGRYADSALAIDGNDVIAISFANRPRGGGDAAHPDNGNHFGEIKHLRGTSYAKVFDVLGLPLEGRTPRGIIYVPGLKRFYFTSKNAIHQLFVTDETGTPVDTIQVPVDNPDGWSNFEGGVYLPADAPAHAGRIAIMGWNRNEPGSRLYFVDPATGALDCETAADGSHACSFPFGPEGTPVQNYNCGIGYQAGKLLVTTCGREVYATDFHAQMIGAGPAFVAPDDDDTESVFTDVRGNVYTAGYETATLRAHDAAYSRLPDVDQAFTVGYGVSTRQLGYDSDTDELLTVSTGLEDVAAISADLTGARRIFSLKGNQLMTGQRGAPTYIGSGQIAITTRAFPRGLGVFNLNDGSMASRLWFPAATFGAGFAPTGADAWDADSFLVSVTGDANALKWVSRTGAPREVELGDGSVATVQLPTQGPDFPLSTAKGFSGVQVLGSGSSRQVFTGRKLFDANGQLIHEIDVAALGLTDQFQGAVQLRDGRYAVLDGDTSTILIVSVP
jgi:hypothetical protein